MKEENLPVREYLYSLRFYILFVIILFTGAIAVGYVGFMSETFNESLEWLQQLSEGIEDFTEIYPLWIIFLMIFIGLFLWNSSMCFLSIILGPLIGIFPMLIAFNTGCLLGMLAQDLGPIVFLLIMPHGIFEIPAFFLSAAIGLRLAREVFKRREERQLKIKLGDGLRAYRIWILPLLLVAAIIESGLIVATLFL